MLDESYIDIDRSVMCFVRMESLAACGTLKLASILSGAVNDRSQKCQSRHVPKRTPGH
jgi:hypothetical protein